MLRRLREWLRPTPKPQHASLEELEEALEFAHHLPADVQDELAASYAAALKDAERSER